MLEIEYLIPKSSTLSIASFSYSSCISSHAQQKGLAMPELNIQCIEWLFVTGFVKIDRIITRTEIQFIRT